MRTQVGIKPSKMLRISFSPAADVIGAASAAGEDAVQRLLLLGRTRVVRDRMAFGNTGHLDDTSSGR